MLKENNLGNRIIGSADLFSLEDRSLNAILFVAFFVSALSFIGDAIQNLGSIQIAYSSFTTLAFGILYFIGRKRPNYQKLVIPFLFVEVTVPPFDWYFLGGISGPSLVFTIAIIIILPILFKGYGKYIILFGLLILLAFLLIYEILHPDFIIAYKTKETQLIDTYLSAAYVSIGAFILINLLIITYRREQQKNKILNKELNANNEELLKQKDAILIKEEALANEKRFRSIFNLSSEGILICDIKGNILEANDSLSKLLSIPVEEIKKLRITDLFPEKHYGKIVKRIQQAFKKERASSIEVALISRGEVQSTIELNTLLMEYNKEKALLFEVRNITSRITTERRILSSVIKAEEKEKTRISQEIHDGLGPLLSAGKIYVDALKDIDDDKIKEDTINKLKEIVNDAIISAKEISNNLSPHILRSFGLKGAIESFFKKLNRNNQFKFIFKTNLEKRLNHELEVTLYRIIVELINNSMKYAEADLIFIELMDYPCILALAYADNGKGFDYNAISEKNTGLGLSNIKNRVKSFNGRVKILSEPGKGFKTDIRLKVDCNNEKYIDTTKNND